MRWRQGGAWLWEGGWLGRCSGATGLCVGPPPMPAMPPGPAPDTRLPRDAQSILELAARSMFDLFANASEGMMLVDRAARVVWINDQYKRFLPALRFEPE